MQNTDKRIDAYIERSADFAKPVLNHLREIVHKANPRVTETIKWSFASFDYKGPLCSMAAFKQHCVFGFWKAKLLSDPHGYLRENSNHGGEAMGNLGRITGMADLPPDEVLIDLIRQASALNEKGIKAPIEKKVREELVIPGYFEVHLEKNALAKEVFEKFSTTNKREYVEWITEAKTEETRRKRLDQAMEWIAEGKIRNWKYVRK